MSDLESQFEDASGREEVLDMLETALHEAHHKVESGRVYDAENEKVRQKWFRTLGYLAGQYRQLKKDKEIEELSERLAQLEEAQKQVDTDGLGTRDPFVV